MQEVRHIVDGNQFLVLTGDNTGDVFLKFVVVFGFDEVLSAFDSKHDVDVNLRVGVGHARKMPLLTELVNLFWLDSTKMSPLTGLGIFHRRNIPGRPPPILAIIFWNLPIFFIICCISPNLFSIVFSSVTLTPLPLAMRMRRLALRICGLRRSCVVMPQIIASMRLNSFSCLPMSICFSA